MVHHLIGIQHSSFSFPVTAPRWASVRPGPIRGTAPGDTPPPGALPSKCSPRPPRYSPRPRGRARRGRRWGNGVRQADGQQHVGGVQGRRRTGRAGGGADAPGVQVEQQGLSLHPFKDKGGGAGQAVHRVAGEAGVGKPGQAVDEPVPQGGQAGDSRLRPSTASRRAAAIPTAPGTFSVPERRPFSWPPPCPAAKAQPPETAPDCPSTSSTRGRPAPPCSCAADRPCSLTAAAPSGAARWPVT